MSARPIGNATISFGLVAIPVKLYSSIRENKIAFNFLHAKELSRIRQNIYCPSCDAVVDRSELLRGYEVEKGKYVSLTDADFKSIESENDQIIELLETVPASSIDPIYFESSYFLGSDPKAPKPYRLFTDALKKAGCIALGQYTMRGKENIVAIRSYGKGLILHTLYYEIEVKSMDDFEVGVEGQYEPEMLKLAGQLLERLSCQRFDPSKFHDRYRQRVLDLIAAKQKGEATQIPELPIPKQAINLFDALKASLASNDDAATKKQPPKKVKVKVKVK